MPFKPPSEFSFHEPNSWPAWKERFNNYRLASKLFKDEEEVQVASLLYAMGPSADNLIKTLNLTEAEKKKYAEVVKALDNHFIPLRNVIHVRAQFHKREQKGGETIEEYLRSLYDLSEHADFKDKEDMIRDRIVLGIKDKECSEKLQLKSDLTLDAALLIARQHELVKKEMEEQGAGRGDIDFVKGRHPHPRQDFKKFKKPNTKKFSHQKQFESSSSSCGRCGKTHGKGSCPAYGKKCIKCSYKNHFANMCRSTKKSHYKQDNVEAEETDSDEEYSKDTFFIGSIKTGTAPWREIVQVDNSKVNFKIDTGADVSVMNKATWHALGTPRLVKQTKIELTSPGGKLDVLGKFDAKLNQKIDSTIYVVEGSTDNLLSRDHSMSLGFIQRLNTNSIAFSSVKCKPVKIKIKEDTVPYSVVNARRVPIPLYGQVKKELQRMEDLDIIEEITEPTDWVAPMVPVRKANGDVRICVDLKRLNQAVQREKFIIPTIDDIIHNVKGSTVFSKLDAQSGFWQVPLDMETAKLTTFITPFGRYFMKRLPFGISSAPEIFMRIMQEILEGLEGVICYFDDTLCHTKTVEEHDALLEKVHKRLQEAGLKLNDEKCEYKKPEIKFLGHIINSEGCRPDDSKIEAIKNLPEPKDVAELRRYLGMVNFLGRYLPHLSTVLKPINDLLCKETAWTWGPKHSAAFKKVQELLTTAPVLAYYDVNKPTVVEADSSSYGLGACLLQEHEDGLKPVAFCSRTLTKTEQKWAQIEKENLAIVWACERFDRYLRGLPKFKVYTDHKPLIPLINTKDLSETPLRCQRLLIRLMRYNPVAIHRPGTTMVTSDTLSRCPAAGGDEDDNSLQQEVEFHVNMVSSTWPVSDSKLEQIKTETQRDVVLKAAYDYTTKGWPQYKQDVALAARELFDTKHELSTHEGLLLRGDKIVIPYKLRESTLESIHEGHLGITKCRERESKSSSVVA